MREGGPGAEHGEGKPETSTGIFARLKEGFDYAAERVSSLTPGSREARFLLRLTILAGVMAGVSLEARAENTKGYAREVTQLEQRLRRAEALLEANIAGGETQYREADAQLRTLRQEWLAARQKDHKYIDLFAEAPSDVEAYFERYGVHIGESTGKKDALRYQHGNMEPQWVHTTVPVNNVLELPNGERLMFDQDTYDVQFRLDGGMLDVLAYNINGSVEQYRLSNGELSQMQTAAHEERLPYPDIQKKYERKEKRAHFGVVKPKPGKKPF